MPQHDSPPAHALGSAHWLTDPATLEQLRSAALTVLDYIEDLLDEEGTFSEHLNGLGDFVCELAELDPAYAPLIEAETAFVVAETAGLRPPSLLSTHLAGILTAIDELPAQTQREIVHRAGSRYVKPHTMPSPHRALAARTRVPHPAPRPSPPAQQPSRDTGPGRSRPAGT